MKLLRNSLLILLLLIVSIAGYVQIATLNQAHMTFRQKILKVFYPLVMALGRSSENGKITMGPSVQPPVSFYSLSGQLIDDTSFSFSQCAGKKVLIVNTASDCGYTQQYAALQQLFEQNGEHLVILAFPSNEFKRQERYSNGAIAEFCKKNYGVTFPIFGKAKVKKGTDQHAVYHWLTDSTQNGWNSQAPVWNFSKYLISDDGKLLGYFGPSVSPEVIAQQFLKEHGTLR